MARQYNLGKRAVQQAETRRRIVEAAIDLHGSIGPAATTFSLLAERAGVQRNTLYAHFPDEHSLLMACSGLFLERDPLPEPASFRDEKELTAKLRIGLTTIYVWYERNASMLSCVVRDAETHALVRQISELRFGPVFQSYFEVLGETLCGPQRALLSLALSFHTWRLLVGDGTSTGDEAVDLLVRAIVRLAD